MVICEAQAVLLEQEIIEEAGNAARFLVRGHDTSLAGQQEDARKHFDLRGPWHDVQFRRRQYLRADTCCHGQKKYGQ